MNHPDNSGSTADRYQVVVHVSDDNSTEEAHLENGPNVYPKGTWSAETSTAKWLAGEEMDMEHAVWLMSNAKAYDQRDGERPESVLWRPFQRLLLRNRWLEMARSGQSQFTTPRTPLQTNPHHWSELTPKIFYLLYV